MTGTKRTFSEMNRQNGRRSASVDGTMSRLIRRSVIVFAMASFGLVAAAPLAHADPCDPLDLGCTLEQSTTTAGEVLEETTTTVGGAVEDTTTTAGEVLEETTTTVGEVLEETTSTAGDVLEGVPGPVGGGSIPVVPPAAPAVVPGEQPPAGSTDPPVLQPAPPGGNAPGGGGGGSTHVVPPASGSRVPFAGEGFRSSTQAGIGDSAGIVGRTHVRSVDDGSGWQMSGVWIARTLAFPVVLILLVIGFVFVQHRIDRKDPKLALAPVSADVLTFS